MKWDPWYIKMRTCAFGAGPGVALVTDALEGPGCVLARGHGVALRCTALTLVDVCRTGTQT